MKGTFTGATRDRPGLFREADGGTLFFDEVGELPERAQAKLLRALETRTIRPVGRDREEQVDVRVVAATNRDLGDAMRRGRFREDLFHRLQVLTLHVSPLRERTADIAAIAAAQLADLGAARGRSLALAPEALEALGAYDWPGNVRELVNVLKRAAIFCAEDRIGEREIADCIGGSIFGHPEARAVRPSSRPEALDAEDLSLADVERRHILAAFEKNGGNVTRAAQALGVDRRTLQRKLRAFGRDVGDE